MTGYRLAQFNIAQMKAPLESPEMADFVAAIDGINQLAEASPGFVWRLQGYDGDATQMRPLGETVLINMSVWESIEDLKAFAFHSAHVEIFRRRRDWFDAMEQAHAVLWWVPPGHQPSIDEAIGKLEHLRQHGPSAEAFTFRQPIPSTHFDSNAELLITALPPSASDHGQL